MKYAKLKVKYAILDNKDEYNVNMKQDILYMYQMMLYMKHEHQI